MAKKKSTKKPTVQPDARLARAARLLDWVEGRGAAPTIISSKTRVNTPLEPVTKGLGTRSIQPASTWRTQDELRIKEEHYRDAGKVVSPDAAKGKIAKTQDYMGTYYGYSGLLRPEYDMREPFTLVDTEAYLKQAINRKLALMFRNGFEITGERPELADYIKRRLSTMEYVTERPTANLFRDVLVQLSLCSNCFLFKIRDEKASGGVRTEINKNRIPIAGYQLIPPDSIFPYLANGKIVKWRRYYQTGKPYDDFAPEEIVHLHWDRKPGQIFGTPRTIAVRDDVFALRRLEENVELLFINHLFPLFHVKVGTDDDPVDYFDNGTSELDYVKFQIENMPKEGVFVSDHRTVIEAVGAQSEALKFDELIKHLKGRVFSGLGMSAVDMGEGDTANRSTADNISQVLKDSIKSDLDIFGQEIRLKVFKELFMETNISMSVQNAVAGTKIEWHEVDTDGKVKEENHAMTMFTNQMVTRSEARKRMKMKPLEKEDHKDTFHELINKDFETHKSKLAQKEAEADVENQKALANTQMKLLAAEVEAEHGKAEAHKKKAHSQVMVLKAKTAHAKAVGRPGTKKHASNKKTAQNRNTPRNQHGTKNNPGKAKSSRLLEILTDKLIAAFALWDKRDMDEWRRVSAQAVDGALLDAQVEFGEQDENSYTNQVRMGSGHLKELAALNPDPEVLYVVLQDELPEEEPEEIDDAEGSDPDDAAEFEGASEAGAGESEPGDAESPGLGD